MPKPWSLAWQDALYGPDGFYRARGGPAAHFTTATHGPTGRVLARALLRLADEHGLTGVVDVGCGGGELLTHLCAVRHGEQPSAPSLRLTGVDVGPRPDRLPHEVEWLVSPGGPALPDELDDLRDVLVVAHEWLDVVPCTVAEVDDRGCLRERLVDPVTGVESWGEPLSGEQLAWAQQHWPATATGDRVEVGLPRDRAWAGLLGRVTTGLVVAVDYGHTAATRPAHGTLVAYRSGHLVEPVPDGTCDLTAHVAMDSLVHDELVDQRTALARLGVDGRTPPVELARTDPAGYLQSLQESSAAAQLTARGGFGDFLWAFSRRG
ncbi:SAM-dependent methyltransferase [Phycicoccus sp. M110.8]|uniref:SAM-dependent methyltransferase n=1 Tax=Phycicoccus sp. M110.8 TaxID=3075433 RepID=UPI0028FD510C|nr:SAM-dependent methyltransferase [Phycicoccus sp. M110.8]MDU0314203.1 SAM-dependent methyltransferase [Phycicoccus sp. M110.8]